MVFVPPRGTHSASRFCVSPLLGTPESDGQLVRKERSRSQLSESDKRDSGNLQCCGSKGSVLKTPVHRMRRGRLLSPSWTAVLSAAGLACRFGWVTELATVQVRQAPVLHQNRAEDMLVSCTLRRRGRACFLARPSQSFACPHCNGHTCRWTFSQLWASGMP